MSSCTTATGAEAHHGNSEVILLVDDEASVRRMVREMLQQSGYDVIEASNGQEALKKVRALKRPPHLMLTDIIMPGMDGNDLARELAGLTPETRILFMSGWANDTSIGKITAIGGQCICKPFSLASLKQTIREMIDSPWKGLTGASRAASK